jgi:hypothetical protein
MNDKQKKSFHIKGPDYALVYNDTVYDTHELYLNGPVVRIVLKLKDGSCITFVNPYYYGVMYP